MVELRKNLSICRVAIYLNIVQIIIPNFWSSLDVRSSGTTGNERTGQSDMENVAYNFTLSYGTCESFGSAYSFCINIYNISYFLVLPIKDMINKDSKLTTLFKLATGTKPSVSHLCVLFCPCVVRKTTANVDKNALNMSHHAKKGFRGIFVGIPQHQKGYLVYVASKRKIISSYDVVFDESFSSRLAYA